MTALKHVHEEVQAIHDTLPASTSISELRNEDAKQERILAALEGHSWLHLACLGIRDKDNSFHSRFLLREEPSLRLVDIVTKQLPSAELAFLSACHSARGDPSAYDEAIHLAAGLQFAGYRSVIGTMWAMDDGDGPVVAKEVYGYLTRGGKKADYREAAEGLARATRALRKARVPLERWICFVHYGV